MAFQNSIELHCSKVTYTVKYSQVTNASISFPYVYIETSVGTGDSELLAGSF
jgi:hypothetical protein